MRRYLFAILIILFCSSICYNQYSRGIGVKTRYLFSAAMVFVTGFAIWILDIKKLVCNPYSIFQGHSAWHLCSAMAYVLIYFYFYSERDNELVKTM